MPTYANTEELRLLGADFFKVGLGLGIGLSEALDEAAADIAATAADIAASYPSRSGGGNSQAVADSIRVTVPRKGTRYVEAGGPGIPLAGLWELGNKGSDPNASTFRHPTFGHDPWEDQMKWPYLRRAIAEYEPKLMPTFLSRVISVLRRFRL